MNKLRRYTPAAAVVCALGARQRRTAVGFGLVAGFLYAATGVYTKEIGDRLAVEHFRAIVPLLRGPVPWLLGAAGPIVAAGGALGGDAPPPIAGFTVPWLLVVAVPTVPVGGTTKDGAPGTAVGAPVGRPG